MPGDFGSRECTRPPAREPTTKGTTSIVREGAGGGPGGRKISAGDRGGSNAEVDGGSAGTPDAG
eukprot:2156511-Lingulodinium_polyedra.AAC.1